MLKNKWFQIVGFVARICGKIHPSCGCRQVVRPQLPKLVSAGSNPVTRSMYFRALRGPLFSWYNTTFIGGMP